MPKRLTSEIVGQREKFLLYGEPGMGKTFCALTAPGPIYFLATGGPNEAKTYFSPDFQKKHGEKEIYIDVCEETIDEHGSFGIAKGFDQACDMLEEALRLDEAGEMEFETIVIDNATILSEFQMNKVFEISHESAKTKEKTSLTKLRDSGLKVPADHDWGGAQSLMEQFVSWLFRLDKHVVFVAHEHQDTTTDRSTHTQTIQAVKPLFIGKQRNQIANRFDNVWRFTINGYTRSGPSVEARTISASSPHTIIAKTRVGGVLSPDLVDPNLTDAIASLQSAAKEVG